MSATPITAWNGAGRTAPSGSAAILVLHLETGWDTHAAVIPVTLPRLLREHWEMMHVPVPDDAKRVAPPAEPTE